MNGKCLDDTFVDHKVVYRHVTVGIFRDMRKRGFYYPSRGSWKECTYTITLQEET